MKQLGGLAGALAATVLAGGVLLGGRAAAAEFGPTCQEFITTITQTNGTPALAEADLAKQCQCVEGKLSDDDKAKAAEGLDMIVQAGKTGKAPDKQFTEEQKAAMKKFGEANAACP